MGKKREVDLELLFDKHKGLVFYFANNNPVAFMEREDYIQSLLLKFWDLIQKFKWGKYNNEEDSYRAFRGYVKQGLTRYMWELGREFYKDGNTCSLNETLLSNDNVTLIDLLEDLSYKNKEHRYHLFVLNKLKKEGVVSGVLLDYIDCGNYSEVARLRGCSVSKVRRDVKKEVELLKLHI